MGMRAGELRNPWNKRNEDNIIQMAREEYARTFMHRRLQSMTACVDTSGPKASNMKHLELRLKKVQLQEDRRQTIARDNRKLMEKMTDIIKGRGKAPLSSAPSMVLKGSLNERERRLYVDKVNSDNKLLLQRLKTQTAYINVPKMEEEYQRWLEHRKMCSRAYKRQRRAQLSARKRRVEREKGDRDGPRSLSPLHERGRHTAPGTADSDPLPGTQARGLPFRTAKQLKDGLLREPGPHSLQAGGFVPLPSLVQLPPASAQPTYNYSNQDKGGHKVGDVPVQFAIHHQGSSSAASPPKAEQPSRDASPERPPSAKQSQQGEVGEQTSSLTLPPA